LYRSPPLRPDMSATQSKTVLLVGETGHGKSFLGNHLLGRLAFEASERSSSVTSECSKEVSTDGKLNVIDCIGLFDTSKSPQEVHTILSRFADLAPDGVHAVVVVLSLSGGRFTESVVRILIAIALFFGADVWSHAVVVYNQTEKTPTQIWEDDTVADQLVFLEKWKAAGTVICTLPYSDEDDPQQRGLSPSIQELKQVILGLEQPYDPEAFRRARQELEQMTADTMEGLKTEAWKQQMETANQLLLDGKVDMDKWQRARAAYTEGDEEAHRQNEELAALEAAAEARQQREAPASPARRLAVSVAAGILTWYTSKATPTRAVVYGVGAAALSLGCDEDGRCLVKRKVMVGVEAGREKWATFKGRGAGPPGEH